MDAVNAYRHRRQKRLDARGIKMDEEVWKTIKGTHVEVGENGQITKGPERLKNLPKKKGVSSEPKIGKGMSPINTDYAYEDGDSWSTFIEKNLDKLKPIYEEHGIEACQDEFYKFRMARTTRDLHKTTKDEAEEVMYDNVSQNNYDAWFRNADSDYKPLLTEAVTKSPEIRNAALNLAYDNYKCQCESERKDPLPFEQFLVTPIKLYRGEKGQKHVKNDVFDAYTFDRKTAEYFAGSGKDARVTEIEVRPIDTYGSMRSVGEAEIWIPSSLSPVGYRSK